MFEVEDQHWWYVGNHEIFLELLNKHSILKKGINVLDAGCGTGKWLEILKKTNEINETGIDYNPIALDYARTRGKLNLEQADINDCDLKIFYYDLITSFDVICSRHVSDKLALKKMHSWLKDDGYLLLTVPAYQFLLSKHDDAVHQNKRYSKKQIRIFLESQGFEIIKISYNVCLLFPVAFIKRIIDKLTLSKKTEHNEVKMPCRFINSLFLKVMRIEKLMMRYSSLPFGLSVMVLAKKTSKITE